MDIIRAQRGLISRLSREIGIARSAISEWKIVPAERLLEVERITGIPREQLRPEIFDLSGRTVRDGVVQFRNGGS